MLIESVLATTILFSQGTDTTLVDVLAGRAVPLELALNSLPTDFLPMEIRSAPPGGAENEPKAPRIPTDPISGIAVVWTNGRVLRVDGHAYYVTYSFDLRLESAQTLRLRLIRLDSVLQMTPLGRELPGAPAPSLVEYLGGGEFLHTGPTPVFLTQAEAVSGSGRASRHAAMKALLLRTEILLAESKNVFPYVQSSASMYGVLAGARATAMSPMDFYRLTACPREGVRFVFNMSLAGVDAGTLPNGASLPVWYEQDPDLDGNRIVGLLNGSTRLVNSAEWSANYTTLLRKTYRKAQGVKPLPTDYALAGIPRWLR